MKTVWNGRFRLFIGTKGGNVLRGLHLRSSSLGPAGTFSTVPHHLKVSKRHAECVRYET